MVEPVADVALLLPPEETNMWLKADTWKKQDVLWALYCRMYKVQFTIKGLVTLNSVETPADPWYDGTHRINYTTSIWNDRRIAAPAGSFSEEHLTLLSDGDGITNCRLIRQPSLPDGTLVGTFTGTRIPSGPSTSHTGTLELMDSQFETTKRIKQTPAEIVYGELLFALKFVTVDAISGMHVAPNLFIDLVESDAETDDPHYRTLIGDLTIEIPDWIEEYFPTLYPGESKIVLPLYAYSDDPNVSIGGAEELPDFPHGVHATIKPTGEPGDHMLCAKEDGSDAVWKDDGSTLRNPLTTGPILL